MTQISQQTHPKARELRWHVLSGFVAGLAILFMLAWPAVMWFDLPPDQLPIVQQAMRQHVDLLSVLVVASAVLGAVAVRLLFIQHVRPIGRLAEQIDIMVQDEGRRLKVAEGETAQPLLEAINRLAEARGALHQDVQVQIAKAKASLETERNRLAALMAELVQSVVVCNREGRILLYNHRARMLFRAISREGEGAIKGAEQIGLGRSIYKVLDQNLVGHAMEHLQRRLAQGAAHPHSVFMTTTPSGQFIKVHMAAVQSKTETGVELTGYVLLFENITRNFEAEKRRDELMYSVTEESRAAISHIRSAAQMLLNAAEDHATREQYAQLIAQEAQTMSLRLGLVSNRLANSLKNRWPLAEMQGHEFVQALSQRLIERLGVTIKLETIDDDIWLRLDSFTLVQAISYLASRLHDEYEIRDLRLRLQWEKVGQAAYLDVIWFSIPVSTETVMGWELEPMHLLYSDISPLSVREVVERHGGAFWFEREKARGRMYFRFLLPGTHQTEDVDSEVQNSEEGRPEYYDFDLFSRTSASQALDDCPLSSLTYTVFDTETTGLEPSKGDEIIQIGATRIVNGRLLRQESFEQLIDPQRDLPPQSTAIHGITSQMLRGKPTIQKVLPTFHGFAQETVLVAHNAAFDMRFLQLKEAQTGLKFDQPVLDTMLLSAVVHPQQESHSLEAIAERLGLKTEGRHTALADAILTGEVFLRLLPLLEKQGIHTLHEAREAAEKTWYARINY